MGGGLSSLNLQIRKELDLFAHVCHAYDLPGVRARHKHVDVIIVRENTEGEYAGLEHEVVPGVVESIKVITEPNSRRIARYAFEYAVLNNRKRVTCVHKANIMKLTDGLFLKASGRGKGEEELSFNQVNEIEGERGVGFDFRPAVPPFTRASLRRCAPRWQLRFRRSRSTRLSWTTRACRWCPNPSSSTCC